MQCDTNEYEGLVVHVAKTICRDLIKNEDVMQAGRLGLCEALATFDETRGNKTGWLAFRIRARMIDELRSMQRYSRYSFLGEADKEIPREPDANYEADAEYAAVTTPILMECLDDQTADVIRRYYGVGCDPVSQADISRERGVTAGRISQIVTAAHHKMRLKAHELGLLLTRW